MGEAAAIVSAISALVAGITVIIIHFQSRSLMRRIERPVISLITSKVKPYFKTVHLFLEFENIGRNPAIEMKVHMFGCVKGEYLIKKIDSVHIVNQKDPGVSFSWDAMAKVPGAGLWNFLFYIGLTYQDIFTNKYYPNELWFIYKAGKFELKDMDIKDCRKMKEEMEKITFYQDLHKNFY